MRVFPMLLPALALAGCGDTAPGRVVGQLESDRVEVAAESAEPITAKLVAEGDRVSAGTPLMQQDTARIEAAIAEAAAALGERRARLAELVRGQRDERMTAQQATLDGALHDLEFRRAEYKRAQDLLDRKLASYQLRDTAKANLDAAEANFELQQAIMQEYLNGTTDEELAQAEQAVRRAEAQVASLEIDFERHRTVAPIDGYVDSILLEPGERPVPGQPLLVMLAGEQPYARIYVPESIRAQVRPGTEATVFVDGRDRPVAARVRWVSSEASFTPYFALTEHDRSRLSFVAKVDLVGETERLPDGVPVEVQLSNGPAQQ